MLDCQSGFGGKAINNLIRCEIRCKNSGELGLPQYKKCFFPSRHQLPGGAGATAVECEVESTGAVCGSAYFCLSALAALWVISSPASARASASVRAAAGVEGAANT